MTPVQGFRDATPADVDAIVALVTSAYRGDASRVGWTTEADLLEGSRIDPDLLRTDIARPRSRVLLAETTPDGAAEPALLACAHVAEDDGVGYFGMFAVRPDLQGAGLGHVLLTEAERIAREDWHLPAMRMAVIDLRESLIAWYERRGYRRTGVYKPFPYGDVRFGIPKRDDLRFEVLEKAL
ncbi:GNAT family N-acetyltransferase [Luteimonas suaedae]|uniref:GNAT family N-acetyltransferase n=1 Tax=Luteimonas suaedae TaxID=2605430 RepID=UPI0011EE562E|nr:GNAT family N-acetyltransferase [Luteimonas suaedae]